MRLEKKHEQELAERKGRTGRTIVQLIWFIITFAIAYFITEWVFAEGWLTPAQIYQGGVPLEVPEWAIQAALMLLIVVVIQFFTLLGFMFGSPRGRGRLGRPSAHTWNPDSNDDRPY